MKILKSEVPQFEGLCKPHRLNLNSVDIRITGAITGFFKLVKNHWLFGYIKTGKEFHGYITSKGIVKTTEGIYNSYQFK